MLSKYIGEGAMVWQVHRQGAKGDIEQVHRQRGNVEQAHGQRGKNIGKGPRGCVEQAHSCCVQRLTDQQNLHGKGS
eukprot:1149425-Pelagomonas_calceolata.AAC.3